MSSSASVASWDLLDEKEEHDLHKHRLLNVEEKPFKRITKRLVTISTRTTNIKPASPCTAPAASDAVLNGGTGAGDDGPSSIPVADATQTQSSRRARTRHELAMLKEDLALDFAAFESSIARLQFLLDANARERERYQADQERILGESAAVREQNAALREQLEVARGTLAQRKKFDELAERITSNKALKPRTEQRAALLKLEEECAELERESDTYKVTWRERREQFARIMEEGMNLRRLIRDEKEEVDRREGMNEDADNQDGGEDADASASAGVDTPHAGDVAVKDASTPRAVASVGGRTPARDGSQPPGGALGEAQRPDTDMLMPVAEGVADAGSRSSSREHSRDRTPQQSTGVREDDEDGDGDEEGDDDEEEEDDDDDDEDDGEVKEEEDDDDDIDMVDPDKAAGGGMPQITVYAPGGGGGDSMEVDAN